MADVHHGAPAVVNASFPATLPDITHEEAYARVPPLDGTPPVTITWELPKVDDPELAAALDSEQELTERRHAAVQVAPDPQARQGPQEQPDLQGRQDRSARLILPGRSS